MLTRDRIGGIALLLFALAVMWEDRAFPLGTVTKPGPGYMPMLLASILAAMAILVICTGGRSPALTSLGWCEWRHATAILGSCAFAALALERLGYRITVFLLVAFLLGVMERRGPLTFGLMAVGLSLATYYVFYDLLKVPLPLSPWGF
jgi:hypothetical protein